MTHNTFARGPEHWHSYDYHWSIVAGGQNVFILATWRSTGGVNDAGHVWCDHTRWSADTPESPVSILPLLTYRNWADLDPIDLRGAEITARLRGDELFLYGAKTTFWIVTGGCRWHFDAHELTVGEGAWPNKPDVFTLANDESKWRRSWAADPSNPPTLDQSLSNVVSYGFAFVGFGQEPRGRLSLGEFRLRTAE